MFKYGGRLVESAADMAVDFDENGFLDTVEEAEYMRSLEDDDEEDNLNEDDWDRDTFDDDF